MTKVTITAPALDKAVEISANAAIAMNAALEGPTERSLPLSEMLARRNELVDQVNALALTQPAPPQEALDAVMALYDRIEDTLRETPPSTVDDIVTKVAFVAELVREAACPNQDDVESLLADARFILTRACDPMHADKVERRDAHWALVPMALGRSSSAALQAIIAVANDYSEKFVVPADKAHSAADNAQAEATNKEGERRLSEACNEAWKVWDAHCDTYREIVDQILELRAGSAQELLAQVEAYCDLLAVHWAAKKSAPTKLAKLGETDVELVAEHMHAGLKRLAHGSAQTDAALDVATNYLAGATPPVSQDAAWAKVVAEHTAAKGAYDALNALDREEFAEMHDIIDPACRAPGLHYANSTRWTMEQDFENEIMLTAEVKDMLRGRVLASIEARHQLLKSYPPEREARAELLEALSDEAYAARNVLLATPAPNAAGVLLKQEVRVYAVDDDQLGVTDPAYVSFALHDYVDHAYPVQTYLDLLSVAGGVYHTPEAIAFNPRVWIRDYEATGAKVSQVNTMLILTYPDETGEAAGALRDQLAAAPWKYRAVQLSAEARRLEGGDPYYDAGGNSGHRDRRHSERRFHGHVARADNIAFSVVDGRAAPHVEHIDNREAPYIPAAFGVRAAE